MSPHANSIRNATTKRIPRQKPEEIPTTRNDFKLINLVLCAGLCAETRFMKRRKWKRKPSYEKQNHKNTQSCQYKRNK